MPPRPRQTAGFDRMRSRNLHPGADRRSDSPESVHDLQEFEHVAFRVAAQPPQPKLASLQPVDLTFRIDKSGRSTPVNKRAGDDDPSSVLPRRRRKIATLRVNQAVRADVNPDVWYTIFTFCNPRTLATMECVSKQFRELISLKGLWSSCHNNFYGDDLPPAPEGLTERQYLLLIDNEGCMGCKSMKKTRKVYWAFLRRWCTGCFEANVQRHEDAQIGSRYGDLTDCVMPASIDKWRCYTGAGFTPNNGAHKVYSKAELRAAKEECDALWISHQRAGKSPEEWPAKRLEWVVAKKQAVRARLEHILRIEEWQRGQTKDIRTRNREIRAMREQFFTEQAGKTAKAFHPDLLPWIPSYRRAVTIDKHPSIQSWNTLAHKMEAERAQAERRFQYDRESKQTGYWARLAALQATRSPKSSRELSFMGALVELYMSSSIDVSENPRDFAFHALEFVRKIYNGLIERSPPHHFLGQSSVPANLAAFVEAPNKLGPHTLRLDDACIIYEQKILPMIHQRWPGSVRDDGPRWPCPGCVNKKGGKSEFALRALFLHIRQVHAPVEIAFAKYAVTDIKDERFFLLELPWSESVPPGYGGPEGQAKQCSRTQTPDGTPFPSSSPPASSSSTPANATPLLDADGIAKLQNSYVSCSALPGADHDGCNEDLVEGILRISASALRGGGGSSSRPNTPSQFLGLRARLPPRQPEVGGEQQGRAGELQDTLGSRFSGLDRDLWLRHSQEQASRVHSREESPSGPNNQDPNKTHHRFW